MAIVTQPQHKPAVSLARSGVVYILYDATVSLNNWYYYLKIQVWRGSITAPPAGTPIFELRRYPNSNGRGVFDISSILSGYFTDLDYNLPTEKSGNLAVNIKTETGYWNGTREVADANQPPIIQAQYGYNYFTSNVNASIPQEVDGFLTDLPGDLLMTENMGNGFQLLFVRHIVSSPPLPTDSKAVGYKVVTDTGTEHKHTFATTTTVNSEDTILTIKAGYDWLTPTEQSEINNWYKIQLIDAADGDVKAPITFHLKDSCKYPMYKVDWINRYGVWDRLFMYGNTEKSLETNHIEAMRHVVDDFNNDEWKQGDGQFVTFNKTGRDIWTLNTGWLAETYNEAIKQLFLAERVVVDGHSAVLQNKSVAFKRGVTEKMINYTLTFKFAFESINTVA